MTPDERRRFVGTDRFEILGELGRGGMGVVYRAFDAERGFQVALKALLDLDPDSLYRFKREFRSLADVVHPNLITLYELASSADQWFFTMELIDGVDFLAYVADPVPGDPVTRTFTTDSLTAQTIRAIPGEVVPGVRAAARRPRQADPSRLREALLQLANGVGALHDAGYLHCDIKPSNVMVTAGGRVVLLDFGVIAEARTSVPSGPRRMTGTPAYMAPEQARGDPPTSASDWYAVGVVLFEALTGQRMFEGTPHEVLRAKQVHPPPAPSTLAHDLPEDLERLCLELLRIAPGERAGRRDVMRVLGGGREHTYPRQETHQPALGAQAVALVGRESHVAQLRVAAAAARDGGRAVYLHGPSGSGKTSLARTFLAEIGANDDTVVLSGRCYQRESVPFQAVDSLVDALSHYLQTLPHHTAQVIMPRNVVWLGKMFPVLNRVGAFADAVPRALAVATPEPQELRRIAFTALRELLGRLADQRPVVLFIDDLQWGDADSAPLLRAITRPPDAPSILLLATYRDEDAERSPLLQAMFRGEDRRGADPHAIRIPVGPLAPEDARALAVLASRETDAALDTGEADAIVAESGGNPFFVRELARYARTRRLDRDADVALTLDAVILQRVSQLPEQARRLVEVVAVAGKPITQRVAQLAAAVAPVEYPGLLHELTNGQLVRVSGSRDADVIACYHDRIRQAVAEGLAAADLRVVHGRLAEALEAAEGTDAETLAEHFHAAGDDDASTRYALRAADQAAAALAFDRAARLYRFALELRPPAGAARRALEIKLAEALVNAGHCVEGGELYLVTAGRDHDPTSLELRRRAAEQFLQSGHTERGLATMAAVLKQLGLRLPRTPLGAIPSWVFQKLRLYLRGLRYRRRALDQIPAIDLLRIDTCFAVASGMSLIDSARAAPFTTRHLLLALEAGEESRIAIALAIEAAFVSSQGRRAEGRAHRLQTRAETLAATIKHAYTTAVTIALRGFGLNQRGRFAESYETTSRAEAMLRECSGGTWMRKSMELMTLGALMYMGDYAELARQVPIRLAEAEQTGDQFATSNLRSLFMPVVLLAADDPDGARREIAEAETLHAGTAHMQRSFEYLLRVQTELYVGDGRAAYAASQQCARVMARSLISQIELMRGVLLHYRASAALLAAVQSDADRGWLVRRAERDARRMARTRTPWLLALAARIRASAAAARGDRDRAIALLPDAIQQCEASGLAGWAAGARWRLGGLVGGDAGAAQVTQGLQWLSDHGAANPERLAAAITTGFPGR